MTQLTAHEVAGYWVGAGGPRSRAVEWVAIALGESDYNTDAISPVGATGLWQIMPFNAAPYGHAPADLADPAVNASIAVAMSGHGTNCAAWDSCYADINASGRYQFLGWPERGSADYGNLPIVAAQLGGQAIDPIAGVNTGPDMDTLRASLAKIAAIQHVMLPRIVRDVFAARAVTSRAYLPGWRP